MLQSVKFLTRFFILIMYNQLRLLTRAFHKSTHCQVPSPGTLQGTFGVPIGIIPTRDLVGLEFRVLQTKKCTILKRFEERIGNMKPEFSCIILLRLHKISHSVSTKKKKKKERNQNTTTIMAEITIRQVQQISIVFKHVKWFKDA